MSAPEQPPAEPSGPSGDPSRFRTLDTTGSIPAAAPRHGGPGQPLPARFGDYELLEELGRGGMGVVYKARHLASGRLVALKAILAGALASPRAVERFLTEAKAVMRLDHPGIVPVYEIGAVDGQHFFTMQLLPGSLQQEPLPPRQAADLVRRLAEAVQHAHERGVLHRDIKPANVLVVEGRRGDTGGPVPAGPAPPTAVGPVAAAPSLPPALPRTTPGPGATGAGPDPGAVKLTDFGLARLADGSGLTATGEQLGTPAFMAPEQAAGRVREVGPATDVYGLGALLYCLLVGRPPFQAGTALETMRLVLEQEPVPPRRLVPDVPRDLETVCLQCLHKDPRRRYPTAQELAEELARFGRGEPVRARPVGRAERAWRWARRNPAVAGLLAAVALLLLAGAGTSTGLWLEARQRAADETLARERAEDESRRAQRAEGQERAARSQAEDEKRRADAEKRLAEERLYLTRVAAAGREAAAQRPELARQLLEEAEGVARTMLAGGGADPRGWEFGHLGRTLSQQQHTFHGHTGPVTAVAFSPDGARLASGSQDGMVRVWGVRSGQELFAFRGHSGGVRSVCFSPDGRRLASGGFDRAVRVWDATTGQERLALRGHMGPVTGVAFSPDGGRLTSAGEDRTVRLWDAVAGQELLALRGHAAPVLGVAFSPDGGRVASAGDRTVRVWDARSGQELLTLQGHTREVFSVCFSPDGQRLASAGEDQAVRVWDARSGRQLLTLHGHARMVYGVCFSPDGGRLASAGFDQTVRVWEATSGQELLALRGHTDWVWSVAFSPDGTRLASGSGDQTVRLWDARSGQEGLALRGHTGAVFGAAFSPDSKSLATGGNDQAVRIWDAGSGRELLTLRGHAGAVFSVAYDPDGKTLATGGSDQVVRLWDARSGQQRLALQGHVRMVYGLCFSRDGDRLASGGFDQVVRIWDARSGRRLHALEGHTGWVWSVAFSPDGAQLASAGSDQVVRLWDADAGRPVRVLQGHRGPVFSVCFSPDGSRLASAGDDRTVRLWDASSGRELLSLTGHTGPVRSVCFSPDGGRLVSGGQDQMVRVWDARSGQQLLVLPGRGGAVWRVAFSPNGKALTVGADQAVRVWGARSDEQPLTLRGHTGEIASAAFSPDGTRLVSQEVSGAAIVWDVATGQPLPGARIEGQPGGRVNPDGKLLAHVEGNRILLVPRAVPAEQQARLGRWAEPDPGWHAEHADAAERAANWHAVAFHVDRLLRQRPWDAGLRGRLAYALGRLGQPERAATESLHALWLDPQARLWPVAPTAAARGEAAARAGDWSGAAAEFRLAAHQPGAALDVWTSLLLAQLAARQEEDARQTCRALLDRFESAPDEETRALLWQCQFVACAEADARRLVQLAERQAGRARDAAALHGLGAALYRAGRSGDAARALESSLQVHGKGGQPDSAVFLAMTQHRLGRHEEARQGLARFEDWLSQARLDAWQDKVRWQALHREARALILAMPRVPTMQ